MIPGKRYSNEELLLVLHRRKWLVLACVIVGAIAGAVVSKVMPQQYQADTLIMVVPQRVPEAYVHSTVTARIEDRLHSISQEILSRVRLERIQREYNLYSDLSREHPEVDIVERMRKDIDVKLVGGDSFRVSYISADPQLAKNVTERLAALFIEENQKERTRVAEGTSDFLDTQLEAARKQLEEQEKKLEVYRRAYSGELPTQLEANQQLLQNTQLQLQGMEDALNRDRDRRLALDRELTDYAADHAQNSTAGSTSPIADKLVAARANLKDLTSRYTDEHPDVIRARRDVKDLERQAGQEASLRGTGMTSAQSTADAARQNRVRELREELANTDRQIASHQAEEQRLRGSLGDLRRHIDATPTRESELTALTRDYTTISAVYTGLLAKKEDSKIAENLERRQVGEQFRILDPPRVPKLPFAPNHLKITGFGVFSGIALAIAIVALLEYMNSSLRNEEELTACTGLAVIAVIPLMNAVPGTPTSNRFRRLLGPAGDVSAAAARQ